jgi:hypothetical protein
MRSPRLLAAAGLVFVCTVLWGQPAKDEGDGVTGPAPTIVSVVELREGRGELVCEQLVLQQIPVKKVVKVRKGDEEVAVETTVFQSVTKALRTKFALKDCEVRTAGGKRLTGEEVSKQLTAGRTLLVSVGGKPASKYLKILREDTLILVSKAGGFPPNPDAVPPPAAEKKEDKDPRDR